MPSPFSDRPVVQCLRWGDITQERASPPDTQFTTTGRRIYVTGDIDGAFRARLTALHRRTGYKALLRRLFYPGYRIRRHVDECVSVENKHPGSTVVLEQLGNNPGGDDLRALVRDVRDAYRSSVLPLQFEWVKPYANRVAELCDRLLRDAG